MPRSLLPNSLTFFVLSACVLRHGDPQTTLPEDLVIDVGETARIIFIGDTGELKEGEPKTCSGNDSGFPAKISPELIAAMQESVRAEQADVTVVLGDVYYPNGLYCNEGALSESKKEKLDALFGDYIGGFETPVLILFGNHDVKGSTKGAERAEHCLLQYAEETEGFFMPERSYMADLGPAYLSVIDTNRYPEATLSSAIADRLTTRRAEDEDAWILLAGHRGLRTYSDHDGEPETVEWMEEHGIAADLVAGGHAHFLQMGIYDVAGTPTPNLTSGSGGLLLCRDECGPGARGGEICGEGQIFGRSDFGYAVVDVTPDRLTVDIKDTAGTSLFCWTRTHADPEGEACP